MESEGVSLPLIHEHLLMPCNYLSRADCCGRFGFTSGGYYCKSCSFYVHKKCVDESSEYIEHTCQYVTLFTLLSFKVNQTIYVIYVIRGSWIYAIIVRSVTSMWIFTVQGTHHQRLLIFPRRITTSSPFSRKGPSSTVMPTNVGIVVMSFLTDAINRHDHRVSRTSVLGVVNSVCEVCRQKVDWTWGGYSCQKCPRYVVHSICATRKDVWNGKELEGVPEETEDIEPYVVIDDNTIQHFSHKEHYLRFHVNGLLWEENKRCSACTHPIGLQSFYGCIGCDFILHQNCAESPRKKWHVLHNDRLTLVTSKADYFLCTACDRLSNGFKYQCENIKLDVLCGSLSEPFVHPSHPHHPLYYIPPVEEKQCNGCNNWSSLVLTCIESGSGFFLCFDCARLPQMVKHGVDAHPLSLCYGEKASGKYWCDICEQETNPSTWFYTCKDHRASLHTKCVLGDFARLMPGSTLTYSHRSYEVVRNTSMSSPFCRSCKSYCMYPIILKMLGTSDLYICSLNCIDGFWYPKIVSGSRKRHPAK